MSLGILRKPSLQDTFLLLEHLQDTPEAAERKSTDYDGQYLVLNNERNCAANQSGRQPDPPAALAPVILHLDDQGMADADA